jgi:uncharacterized protein (TIGR02231 family)
MSQSTKLLLGIVLSLISWPAIAAPADEATPAVSKITEVTVYADRSRVVRTTEADLPAGTSRLSFAKLPGWLDEGSVRVALTPASAGRITDVQVIRTFLAQPDDEEIRKLEADVLEIQDQIAELNDELQPLEAQQQQVANIRTFSAEKWTKETAVREVKIEEYTDMVNFVGSTLSEIAKSKRSIEKQKRELQPILTARTRKLVDLRQCMQLEQRTVIVTIVADKPGRTALALTYMLPGTTWEPTHELRASQDGKMVEMTSFAVVSQTTGEDWDGVNLILSTQRPLAPVHIPELESLAVGTGRPLAKLAGANDDSFQIAQKNWSLRNEEMNGIMLTGNNSYAGKKSFSAGSLQMSQGAYNDNVKRQNEVQKKIVTVFERVQQQRGTTMQFAAPGRQTVRTDGRPVRVPIGTLQLAAAPRIVAAPELSLNAVQTVDLANTGLQPVLPGKVALFLDGALVGSTEVEFVAPGEGFAMFLGVADRIKLSRGLDKKSSSMTWTGKRKKLQVAYLVTAENLSDRPVTLELADRIPVSDNDDIRVNGVKLQPDTKPDPKGLLKWDATLAAREKKEFRIEYTITYPQDLRINPAKDTNFREDMNAPAQPAAELHRQIQDLETNLK